METCKLCNEKKLHWATSPSSLPRTLPCSLSPSFRRPVLWNSLHACALLFLRARIFVRFFEFMLDSKWACFQDYIGRLRGYCQHGYADPSSSHARTHARTHARQKRMRVKANRSLHTYAQIDAHTHLYKRELNTHILTYLTHERQRAASNGYDSAHALARTAPAESPRAAAQRRAWSRAARRGWCT